MSVLCQAIVLQSTPFQEHNHVLKLFTKQLGLIPTFVKASGKKPLPWAAPLTELEVHLVKGQGELYKSSEMNLLDAHLSLRENNKTLNAAIQLLKTLSLSQLPEKPAPLLFDLLLFLLKALEQGADPLTCVATFRLKILLHEGLLDFPLPQEMDNFTKEEETTLSNLTSSRSATPLFSKTVSPALDEKLSTLFQQLSFL